METVGGRKRMHKTLYVSLMLVQQDLVSLKATCANRSLDHGVVTEIEHYSSGNQFQDVGGARSEHMEPCHSVSCSPAGDSFKKGINLAF